MWATPGSLHMVPTQAECSAPGLHKQGSANPEQREQSDTETWQLGRLSSPIVHFWQRFCLGFPAELLENTRGWVFPGVDKDHCPVLSVFNQHFCTQTLEKTSPWFSALLDGTYRP